MQLSIAPVLKYKLRLIIPAHYKVAISIPLPLTEVHDTEVSMSLSFSGRWPISLWYYLSLEHKFRKSDWAW